MSENSSSNREEAFQKMMSSFGGIGLIGFIGLIIGAGTTFS
jgi:hypothetical protein